MSRSVVLIVAANRLYSVLPAGHARGGDSGLYNHKQARQLRQESASRAKDLIRVRVKIIND